MKPMGYFVGFILIIFLGVMGVACINSIAEVDEEEDIGRRIEVVPKECTLVPLTTKPIFIQGLAQPDPEPPTVPKTIVYIQQDVHGVLSADKGVNIGPTNKETWYNLDMTPVIDRMRRRGYTEDEYPYYIREDRVKCLGDYVMVAADLDIHPRGTIVETSLGQGIVCDTGDFTEIGDWYDIATDW